MAGDGVLTQVIDPASDRAVYKQIADHLRDAIARSRLREGEQLPSEAQLMEHYGVARMTIRNALRVLQDEGLTTAEHGRGVYVRARPPVRRLASDRFAQRHRKEDEISIFNCQCRIGSNLVDDSKPARSEKILPRPANAHNSANSLVFFQRECKRAADQAYTKYREFADEPLTLHSRSSSKFSALHGMSDSSSASRKRLFSEASPMLTRR